MGVLIPISAQIGVRNHTGIESGLNLSLDLGIYTPLMEADDIPGALAIRSV